MPFRNPTFRSALAALLALAIWANLWAGVVAGAALAGPSDRLPGVLCLVDPGDAAPGEQQDAPAGGQCTLCLLPGLGPLGDAVPALPLPARRAGLAVGRWGRSLRRGGTPCPPSDLQHRGPPSRVRT